MRSTTSPAIKTAMGFYAVHVNKPEDFWSLCRYRLRPYWGISRE